VDADHKYSARVWLAADDARKRGDIEFLLALLSDTDRASRRTAVSKLGQMGDRRAVKPLIRSLLSADVQTQIGAIKSLARIGDPAAVPDLHEVATGSDPFAVRIEAARALGLLGDSRGAELICSMIWDDHNPYGRRYRRWAAKRLVELDATDAIGDLERATEGAGAIGGWHLKRAIRTLRDSQRRSAIA
jgi:HEAT repeat protein